MRRVPRGEIGHRVGRALDLVRLAGFGHRRPAQLSGGQQQRVALARALVFEPKLVLMDEPLGALDKQLREQMQIEIKHIHQRLGVTFVSVTHDQTEALTMSDRVAIFNDGAIQQIDSPEQVYEAPANAFVAHFIGENNQLSGHVLEAANGTCTVELHGGARLSGVPGPGVGKGSLTTVSLRPERVLIGDEVSGCVNRFEGEIRELIYIGDHTRMRLAICGVEDFIVKVAHGHGLPEVRAGERIEVGFRPEDCRALDREA